MSENRDKNVAQLIGLIQNENLFSFVPGRHHRAFPDVVYSENPVQAGQLKYRCVNYQKNLIKEGELF